MRDPGYPVFDADNHMYETTDALLKYLPKKYKGQIEFVQMRRGTRIALKGKITEYIPNPTFERVAAPGVHADYYRATNTEGRTLREMTGDPIESRPAFREPAPRVEVLDRQGVARALVYPTLANLVEQTLIEDPDLTHAAIHALNQWMHETWTYNYHDRLYCTPVLTLPIVEEAVAELEWVLERGAKAILIRPAPVNGLRGSRSIALPEFDPFWARVQEAGIPVCFHGTFSIFSDYAETWEPHSTDSAFKMSPFKVLALGHRDIEDTIASMICHGALTRFPDLKIASIENGAAWVPNLAKALDRIQRQMPQEFAEHPVEVFRRNVYVSPFWEDDVASLVDVLGDDRIMFGSDYPHPEGVGEEPLAYLDTLTHLDETVVRKFMSDNAHELLGVSVAAA